MFAQMLDESFSVFMFVILLSANMTNVSGHINNELALSPQGSTADRSKKRNSSRFDSYDFAIWVRSSSFSLHQFHDFDHFANESRSFFINVSLFRVCIWRVRSSILYSNLIDGGIKMGCSAVSLLCVACLPKSPSIIYLLFVETIHCGATRARAHPLICGQQNVDNKRHRIAVRVGKRMAKMSNEVNTMPDR